ncbi:MAG TPA: hypothetical protein VFC75_01570, partial [Erysipelothrix sp.]|nr:hypothetical protein [Erysipelothrix sp.]
YQYGPMYYLMIIYLIVLIFSMLINLIHKSFNHRKNNLVAIPFMVLAFGLMYVYIYIFTPQFVFLKYFDLTFMMVYINIIFLESVIMSGIITVNTDHQKYFEQASFKAQIMNQNKEILFKNKNAYNLSDHIKEEIIHKGHFPLNEHTHLNSDFINQHYIIWEEDHQAIHESFETKKEIQSELLDELSILKLDVEIQRQALTLTLKNEMYDVALQKVENDMKHIQTYIDEKDLFKVTLAGIIVKRKLNLILIAQNNHHSSKEELFLSIQEVFNLLNQHNYQTSFNYYTNQHLPTNLIYQAFDTITSFILNTLDSSDIYEIEVYAKDDALASILINHKEVLQHE